MRPENFADLLEAERRGGAGAGLQELSVLEGKSGTDTEPQVPDPHCQDLGDTLESLDLACS